MKKITNADFLSIVEKEKKAFLVDFELIKTIEESFDDIEAFDQIFEIETHETISFSRS